MVHTPVTISPIERMRWITPSRLRDKRRNHSRNTGGNTLLFDRISRLERYERKKILVVLIQSTKNLELIAFENSEIL